MQLRPQTTSRLPGGRRVWFLGGVSAGAFGALLLVLHLIARGAEATWLGGLGAPHVLWNALAWIGCGGVALLSWVATPGDRPGERDRRPRP